MERQSGNKKMRHDAIDDCETKAQRKERSTGDSDAGTIVCNTCRKLANEIENVARLILTWSLSILGMLYYCIF